METIFWYALSSVLGISFVSFAGLVTLIGHQELIRKALIYFISFAAGVLLGNAFLHLLPSAAETLDIYTVGLYCVFGIIFFFLTEKIMHVHHQTVGYNAHAVEVFGYINLLTDGVHNVIDGIVIAIAYMVSIEVGLATTFAIALHELPQELADFGVLLHAGFTYSQALFFNFISALAALLGVAGVFIAKKLVHASIHYLVALAAGGFIYLAVGHLIPEMHKYNTIKRSLLEVFFFGIGFLIMALL